MISAATYYQKNRLSIFTMQLLTLIFLASTYVLTSNADCSILPITPTEANGLTPCGYGGLIADCVCCPDGQTACLNTVQVCALGSGDDYICENENGPTCASQDLADCGSGCMPSSATCCPGQTIWCPAGYYCGANSDCLIDSSSSSVGSSSLPAPSTPTTKDTATSPTSTSHSHSSSIATRKGYGGIGSLVTMIAMNVFIFSQL